MAKRFTDTNKYKKPFIRSLSAGYKLLWDYLYHDCDHAGMWIVDFTIAQTYVGKDVKIRKDQALKLFNADEERIVEVDNGKKWFIPSFIEFQYGRLSEKNRAHINVISILKKYMLIDSNLNIKPLTSPLQGDKEQEQEQEKEMEKEKAKGLENSENFLVPELLTIWKKHIPGYPVDKNKDSTALQKIALFICEQSGMNYYARDKLADKELFKLWDKISGFVSSHNFFRNYSLHQVDTHIQSITQEIKNGQAATKNGKTGTGKPTSEQLNKAFADFYSQGKPV